MTTVKSSTILMTASAAAAVGFLGGILWMKRRNDSLSDEKVENEKSMSPDEALSLIRRRRSIFSNQFTGVQVPQKVLDDMLEAARWAPSHHLTEAWHFVVFQSQESRNMVGEYLANAYKKSSEKAGKFSQGKYEKKLSAPGKSSFVIALCCKTNTGSMLLEEICSVACAVQNMHLAATSHNVGAYWSSSGIYANSKESVLENPIELLDFLELPKEEYACVGWMFIGDYQKAWPLGRRRPCSHTLL